MKVIALLLVTMLISTSLLAHGGRTDKKGCHKDRAAGHKHCH